MNKETMLEMIEDKYQSRIMFLYNRFAREFYNPKEISEHVYKSILAILQIFLIKSVDDIPCIADMDIFKMLDERLYRAEFLREAIDILANKRYIIQYNHYDLLLRTDKEESTVVKTLHEEWILAEPYWVKNPGCVII